MLRRSAGGGETLRALVLRGKGRERRLLVKDGLADGFAGGVVLAVDYSTRTSARDKVSEQAPSPLQPQSLEKRLVAQTEI